MVKEGNILKLHDLWKVSPQAFVFIVERDERLMVTSKREYNGTGKDGERAVTRVTPTIYPMHGPTLEVEIE